MSTMNLDDPTLFDLHPLWTFCVQHYGRPGVATACLRLQDEHGLDVNMVLACLWWERSGGAPLPSERIDGLLRSSQSARLDVQKIRQRRYSAKRSKKRYRKSKKRTVRKKKRRYVSKRKKRTVRKKKRRYVSKRKKRTVRKKKRRYVSKRKKRTVRRSKKRYVSRKKKRTYKRRKVARKRTVRKKRTRKYSKRWWANYRARQARNKAVAKRKRTLRTRSKRLARKKARSNTRASERYNRIQATPSPAPRTRYRSDVGSKLTMNDGDFSIDVVGQATGETVSKGRRTSVGGVSTTKLRRTVIDQMIRENGWVENDYHKEVDGKKVYVVVAKSQGKNNRVQSRTYYFTESNGRIYRVASKASEGNSENAKKRSEDMIRSIEQSSRPQQAKKN